MKECLERTSLHMLRVQLGTLTGNVKGSLFAFTHGFPRLPSLDQQTVKIIVWLAGESKSSLGGGSFKWWYGLIIAIGAVVLLAAITGVVLVLVMRRRERRGLDAEQANKVHPLRQVG